MAIYIPLLTQKDLIVDQNKQIMPEAKIDILDPISNNPLDVYTYDGAHDRYVLTVNPIILNVESRPEQTYFVKTLAYCRLSKFLGNFYDGETGSTAASWQFVRDWFGAWDPDEVKNDTIVTGFAELQDANPELGKVTVVGYWTDKDCESRTYVWDPNCTQDADGGYIVKNRELDVGRWILMFDGEYIPSSYYGVYPGHESTMNSLLNYVATVGTAQKPTAPGIYFVPGVYSASTTGLTTSKKVLLDADTCFTRNTFIVGDLKVVGTSNYWIGDFIINNPNAEAHSSWFRTLAQFYMCGAKTLYYDNTNYFANTQIDSTYELNQKTVIGTARLPATYGSNGRLRLVNCNIQGTKLWSNADKLYFATCEFRDEWFLNPESLDFVNDVNARTVSLVRLSLSNFVSTTAYINAMAANGATYIDLEGRSVSSISIPASVTELRNAYCVTLSISKSGTADIWLKNVTAAQAYITARYITMENGCNVTFSSEPSYDALWGNDSTVSAETIWTSKKRVMLKNCHVSITFNRATNNDDDEASLWLENCSIATNCGIQSKKLTMIGCRTDNNAVKVYPYKDGDKYRMYINLKNNLLNNSQPIEFTKFDDDKCYEIIVDWTIVGNTFTGNDEGLRCRYWHHRLGNNFSKTFIAWSDDNVIAYYGNVGKCPQDTAKDVEMTDRSGSDLYQVDLGDGLYDTLYKPKSGVTVMLNLKSDTRPYHFASEAINGNGHAVRTHYTGNDGDEMATGQGCYIYPYAHLMESVNDGSLFAVSMSKWGNIKEHKPSYNPYYWRFI